MCEQRQVSRLKKVQSQGFTLIELMVALVIIGILVGVSIPNFIGVTDRAKAATVKSNMHTFQTILENYGVDYGGTYPTDIVALESEGRQSGYWQDFENPITGATGNEGSFRQNTTGSFSAVSFENRGKVIYYIDPGNTTLYEMYGRVKEGRLMLKDGVTPYTLSNGY